jgi:hypothetical protein
MGSSQTNILTGRMRHGYGQYFMGTGFLFMLASSLFRMNQKPCITGSLAILWGWVSSAWQRKPRYSAPGFRRFLRRYQWSILLKGKKRVLEDLASSSRGKSLGAEPQVNYITMKEQRTISYR